MRSSFDTMMRASAADGWLATISVLTSAHTLWHPSEGTGPYLENWQVRLERGRRGDTWPFCPENSVIWFDRQLDLALIRLARPEGSPFSPTLRLRVATVHRSNLHPVEARGYPRASKDEDGRRQLTPAFGRLTGGQQDEPLIFGVEACDLPNQPHTDWPGMSGSSVMLRDWHEPEEICIYGIVQAVPANFSGKLRVTRLADAWKIADFRQLLVKAGVPDRDAEDPTQYDVQCASASIETLRNLIRSIPTAADAVGRSKQAIEGTSRLIDKLGLFKTIHDELHRIEIEVLGPLQSPKIKIKDFSPLLRPHRIRFIDRKDTILGAIKGHEIPPFLRKDLEDGLESAAAAFQEAITQSDERARSSLIGELNRLFSVVSPRIRGRNERYGGRAETK